MNEPRNTYADPTNFSEEQIKEMLEIVYETYFSEYEAIGFTGMVDKFAKDDFYHLHLIAKEYQNKQKRQD